MIPIAISLGLVMSLIFSEAFGLAAGGLVVPGYIAVALSEPWRAVGTVAVAMVAFLIVRLIGRFMILYGRRHLVMVILVGCLLRLIMKRCFDEPAFSDALSFEAIGYVIPGLIALWMEKQGVIQTLSAMLMAAALVRLILIVLLGGAPIEIPTIW